MTVGALRGLSYPDADDDVAMAMVGEVGLAAPTQAFEARGNVVGKREAIRRALWGRFGDLPWSAETRLAAATAEQLGDLIGRAITVERLEDRWYTSAHELAHGAAGLAP